MIAASGILVVVAFVTLIVGVFNPGLSLIWVSIASSVLAAVFLALGVMQSNKRRVAPAGGPAMTQASAWTEAPAATTAVMERAPAVAEPEEEEEARPSLAAVPEPEEESFARAPAAKPAAKSAAKPRARTAASDSASVVVVPDRDKFHKETCRYAKNPAAMSMTKAAAKRQGYKACGVCKP